MKILLICPPMKGFEKTPAPPLGLAYLASSLQEHGYHVSIIDFPILGNERQTLADHILGQRPNIVGITCVQANFSVATQIASQVKSLNPLIMTVLGGPHATFTGTDILRKYSFIDVIVKGEAEKTFIELADRVADKKSIDSLLGIVYRDNDSLIETADRPLIEELDSLPYPARHLLRMDQYRKLTEMTTIITSRGCSYRCPYCSSSALWKHEIRFHSPERVVDEMELLMKVYGFKQFFFVDDTFTIDTDRSSRLLERILARKVKAEWYCNTRVDCLSSDLLDMMRAAGCMKITFGIESGSQKLRDDLGKSQINSAYIINTCKKAKDLGIKLKINLIVGLPGEREEDIRQSIGLAKEISADSVTCNFLARYPGTAFHSLGNHKTDGMKRKDLYHLLQKYQRESQIQMALEGAY